MAGEKIKQNKVFKDIVDGIVVGRLSPGEHLPSYNELQKHYKVSCTTLRQAVNLLKQDGQVSGMERQGLYVSEKPACLYSYAIVSSRNKAGNSFVRLLLDFAHEISGRAEIPFRFYADFEPFDGNKAFESLQVDAENHRIGGILFIDPPPMTREFSLRFSNIPLVTISSLRPDWMTVIDHDHNSFAEKALDVLAAKGRRRIAVLFGGREPVYYEPLKKSILARGLTFEKNWFIGISQECRDSAKPIARLLFDREEERRPDALIIADDNFSPYALSGITELPLLVGRDIDIVSHCNWPCADPSILPITRIGYDVLQCLEISLEVLRNAATKGAQEFKPVILLEAQYESEVEAGS